MGSLKDLILKGAITLALSFSANYSYSDQPTLETSQKKEQKQGEINLVYQDFSKIDFDSIPQEKIEPPHQLVEAINHIHNEKRARSLERIVDNELFERLVLEEASKILKSPKYKDQIKTLSTKEAIMLCIDIVVNRMTWWDVDGDKGDTSFIKRFGSNLPLDKYFEIGLGDCERYGTTLIAVFNIIKGINNKLDNIYISNHKLGGLKRDHYWNSLIFLTDDRIILTHIDTSTYDDNKEDLEAKRGYHIPKSDIELLANVHYELRDFESSYELYTQLFDETNNISKKTRLIFRISYSAYKLSDESKKRSVRSRYIRLLSSNKQN